MTVLSMSDGELSRFDTLMRVERGELRVDDAAAILGLKPASTACWAVCGPKAQRD